MLALLPMLLTSIVLYPVARPVEGTGDTFQFWYAGHLVATGRSVHDEAEWRRAGDDHGRIADNVAANCSAPGRAECVWLYPPPTAWLFVPFGLLSPASGLPLLNAFVLLTTVAGVLAVAAAFPIREPSVRALVLVLVAAAHPFVVNIKAGHFVGALLLGVALVTWGLRRGPLRMAIGALVLSLKPHVFLILAPLIAVRLIISRKWPSLISAAVALAAWLASFTTAPDALRTIITSWDEKAVIGWSTAASAVVSRPSPGSIAPFVVVVVAAALLAARAVADAPSSRRDQVLVASGCALSLVVAPYAQPYDLLLLVPAVMAIGGTAAHLPARARSATLVGLTLAYPLATWGPIVFGQLLEPLYRAIPLVLIAILAGALWSASVPAPSQPHADR